MNAIVQYKYGPPDVLEFNTIEKPYPKEDEVLIKVVAASANPLDWHFMRGTPYFMRFVAGLFRPKNIILGADVAGRVEAIGKNVTQFKIGDEVFGSLYSSGLGAFAEYACAKENTIVLKPSKCSFEAAAATPIAGLTAYQGLRHFGNVQPGQNVLINGASGGVGTFAVQIAKSFDANVTGVCSTKNVELVKSIGADHIIDYTKQDLSSSKQQFDLIIDNVANYSVAVYERLLTSKGTCAIIGFSTLSKMIHHVYKAPLVSKKTNKKIAMLNLNSKQEDLQFLADLIENNQLKPVIDQQFALSETAEAIRYLEKGHARGKVIISM